MGKRLLSIVIGFLLLSLPAVVLGAVHYVDCSDTGSTNQGTYAEPFKTIDAVNDHAMSTGDDVYFKVGTSCTLDATDDKLNIDWDGSSSDRVIIGAYYGEAQFGLNGNARPRIIGTRGTIPASIYSGIINKGSGTGYITVQDIQVEESKGRGISLSGSQMMPMVDNCYTLNTTYFGIYIQARGNSESDPFIIENNTVERSSYGRVGGGGIVVDGNNTLNHSYYGLIRKNTVFHGWEGINVVKRARNVIIEQNESYDQRSTGLYIDAAQNNTIRYNQVYWTSDGRTNWSGYWGIAINNEYERPYCYISDNKVYGNIVSGSTSMGILVKNEYSDRVDSSCDSDNTLVYNNTVVDCDAYNYQFLHGDNETGCSVQNNISYIVDGGSHVNITGTNVWNHDYNLYSSEPITAAKGAHDPSYAAPGLNKTTGWQSMTAGSVPASNWALSSAASPAVNVGAALTGDYAFILHPDSDFVDNVQVVDQGEHGAGSEIGAFVWDEVDPPTPGGGNNCTDCIAFYPLLVDNSDSIGGTSLTFNNSAAIASSWLELENAPSDANQDATLATGAQAAGWWGLTGGTSDGTACITFKAETLAYSYLMGNYDYTNGKRSWGVFLDSNYRVSFYLGYASGASEIKLTHGTPIVAATQYTVCVSYDAVADDGWIRVRDADGNVYGSDLYDDDVLPAEAVFNLEDSVFTIGAAGGAGAFSFDGQIKQVGILPHTGSEFLSTHASEWAVNDYSAIAVACAVEHQNTTAPVDTIGGIGRYTNNEIWGTVVQFTGQEIVCQLDFRLHDGVGTPANRDVYAAIYSMDGDDLDTRLATSTKVDGAAWSDEFVSFTFASPYTCSGSTNYAFVLFTVANDGDPATPTFSGTDYFRARVNDTGAWTVGTGRYWWADELTQTSGIAAMDIGLKIYTQGSAAPTVITRGNPGLITTPDGTCTYAANTTATWSDSTVRYLGVPISGAVTVNGLEGWPTLPLLAGPEPATVSYANYYGQCVDAGAQRYMVFRYTPQGGHQSADLQLSAAELDCDQDNDGNMDATALDANTFDICGAENKAIGSADPGGTGAITVSVPWASTTPLQIGEFTTTDEEDNPVTYYGDYLLMSTAISSLVVGLFPDSFLTWGAFTESGALSLAAQDGTDGHPISYDLEGDVTVGGAFTPGDYNAFDLGGFTLGAATWGQPGVGTSFSYGVRK